MPDVEQIIARGRILESIEGRCARIVISNPARLNAMSLGMWAALGEAVRKADADPAIRSIVIAGEGEQAFCAGADISEFEAARSDAEANAEYDRIAKGALAEVRQAAKPTIASIRGFCIGGGMALALSCDLRFAAGSGRLGIPAARLGIAYDLSSLGRLRALVGPAWAKRILFSAERLSAAEAYRIGLVEELAEAEVLDAAVTVFAEALAANAPLTIRAAKRALDLEPGAPETDVAEALRLADACFSSADFAEGRRAFMEKRRPEFQGR